MNTHVRPPAESLDSFSINLLTQEQARRTSLLSLARLRKEASDQIEQLLIFLDVIDGYTMSEREEAVDDVPCDDDEREFSFSGVNAAGQFSIGHSEDELETSCLNGMEADDEPSLGSLEDHPTGYRDGGGSRTQEWWGSSATDDTEDQCEDEGARFDDEEHEPSGIADMEGLYEQVGGGDWQGHAYV